MAEFTSPARQAPDTPAGDRAKPPGDHESELQKRVRQLEQALASHAVIDRACGVLIAWTRCSPEEAWQLLVRISQHSNTKARLVAEALVTAARGGQLPPELHRHVRTPLTQTGRGPAPTPAHSPQQREER
ncbi:ANTAR domain-containing protein [Streptomyces sp. NPDC102283]|uniref:ANTAR domain-containing protein n=1 Tax=Streptomyces sp. NPDC102283 TaxID=3366155 RepID=UPI003800FC1A